MSKKKYLNQEIEKQILGKKLIKIESETVNTWKFHFEDDIILELNAEDAIATKFGAIPGIFASIVPNASKIWHLKNKYNQPSSEEKIPDHIWEKVGEWFWKNHERVKLDVGPTSIFSWMTFKEIINSDMIAFDEKSGKMIIEPPL